jgi:hypothetical protein
MFVEAHVRYKDGKQRVGYTLTESLRVSRKRVVQRTVLDLGELNTIQVERWQRTIEAVEEAVSVIFALHRPALARGLLSDG